MMLDLSSVGVCKCVCGVLRRFQQYFSHIPTVAACCMSRDSAWVLHAANTDAPCRRHKIRMHHPVTSSWQPVRDNQSCFFNLLMLSIKRGNNQYQFVNAFDLARPGPGPKPRHPDYEANALSTRPRSRSVQGIVYWTRYQLKKAFT